MSRDLSVFDHAVVLQTERSLDYLTDRVEKVEEEVTYCDCDCADQLVDDVRKELQDVRKHLQELLRIMLEHLESCGG